MPRTYKKLLGAGGKKNYNEIYLQNAVKSVRERKMNSYKASEQYGVPRSSINDAVKGKYKNKQGGQTALSIEEEKHLTEGLLTCAKWGFPLCTADVQNIVEDYLKSCGKIIKRFKNNRPGDDFVRLFLKRNRILTIRRGENIKRSRASVTRKDIDKYFENLALELNGVPSANIINYDETNFTDDPGHKTVITRRGVKHVEHIRDHSKTSISVMFAAAADGKILPPYTVYKAKNIYPSWIENGIAGAGYNRSLSGWFDSLTFKDWFNIILLPYARKLTGRKVLIGDNLSSHLSINIIQQCRKHNISFVLLPPNSTHMCQPLDVAYFRPLKRAWRNTLSIWKSKNKGVLPKSEFPRLLKLTLNSIGTSATANILAGFKKCGICPIDPQKVISQIPSACGNESANWMNAFEHQLETARFGDPNSNKKSTRGKRINIQAGKGVVTADFSRI